MTKRGYALFETPIGRCGIAWNGREIAGVQLPEASDARTRKRLALRFPDFEEAPPPAKIRAVERQVTALLCGEEPCDFARVPLDMRDLPPFRRRVYEAARKISPGSTSTYGELARKIGSPGAARAVGQALGQNPFAILVPCHRVLAASGKLGGFSAQGGVRTKQRLLALERACIGTVGEAKSRASRKRGLAFDPGRAVRALRKADPDLVLVFEAVGACRLARELRRSDDVFATLCEAIVAQQLSAKAAATIYTRLRAQFPGSPDPTPDGVWRRSEARLRSAGLSRAKAASLRDLARKTRAGEIPSLAAMQKMSDEEIVERLTAVRGIGRWSAQMFLIFRLGRPDVLAADDYALRRGFAIAMGRSAVPTPRQFASHAERWAPWRTVASWYLWRVAERGPL